MKIKTARAAAISASVQQYFEHDYIRKSSTIAGAKEPDSDAMIVHIMKCLRAFITLETIKGETSKTEKSKLFDIGILMMASLATSGLMMSVNLWPSQPTSNIDEAPTLRLSEIKSLRRQGKTMQSVYINESAGSYFWAPLYFSMIMDEAPDDACISIRRLHQEYQLCIGSSENDRGLSLSCMEVLLGSENISDTTRLHFLGVLLKSVPWLFFVTDEEDKYSLHLAAFKKCSARVLQYLLRVNPDAANAQDHYGETPLHSLLNEEYEKAKHYDQFKVHLAASKKALRIKDNEGHTPLAFVCKQYGSSAPITVLKLLQAHPAAASTEDDEGNLPIHYFTRTKCHPDHENVVLIVLRALLAANPSAASEVDSDGDYLLHTIAPHGTLGMVKTVYEAYPEAVKYCDCSNNTSLNQAVLGCSVEVLEYLYSLYPEAAQLVDPSKATLLHCAVMSDSLEVLKTVYSYHPAAIRQATSTFGFLPLHVVTLSYNRAVDARSRNVKLGMLRFLLRQYRESARAAGSDGSKPYDLLWDNFGEAPRLLLRAASELCPIKLHQLNYQARRGALYLLFASELPPELEPSGASSAAMTSPGPRRSARVKAAKSGTEPEAVAAEEEHPLIPTQKTASSKIWRLLKGRADTMLWKEIVLFL